jgi:hypothetical protein
VSDDPKPYLVGELGPELIVFNTAGYIIPDHLLPATEPEPEGDDDG